MFEWEIQCVYGVRKSHLIKCVLFLMHDEWSTDWRLESGKGGQKTLSSTRGFFSPRSSTMKRRINLFGIDFFFFWWSTRARERERKEKENLNVAFLFHRLTKSTFTKWILLNKTIEKNQHKLMITSRENYYLSVYTIVHRHCLLDRVEKEETWSN